MKLCVIAMLLACCALPQASRAQDIPSAEVFGGYSYLNVDTNGLSSRQAANGWEAGVSLNVTRLFAVEAEANGYYKNYDFNFDNLIAPPFNENIHVHVTDYSYMGGPRLNLRPVFIHALIGGDHLTGSASGGSASGSASQDSLAGAFGGGIEWRVTPRISLRPSADYVFTRHNILGGSAITQNNFRVGVSIAFGFGGIRSGGGDRLQRPARTAQPQEIGEESVLFGITGVSVEAGVRVTLVRYQSAANRAGVQIDDIVTSIDGSPVRSIRDIEIAVAKDVTGSVRVGYLSKGIGAVEYTVPVAPPTQ
jgi:hypothetical protein